MADIDRIPHALWDFIALVNDRRYWESHEVLEQLWRENGSHFFQGLILFASAFVHAQRGNAHGVTAQLRKAKDRLGPYRPAYLGIDVDELFGIAERTRSLVDGADAPREWTARIEWPKLRVRAECVRGDEMELRPVAERDG